MRSVEEYRETRHVRQLGPLGSKWGADILRIFAWSVSQIFYACNSRVFLLWNIDDIEKNLIRKGLYCFFSYVDKFGEITCYIFLCEIQGKGNETLRYCVAYFGESLAVTFLHITPALTSLCLCCLTRPNFRPVGTHCRMTKWNSTLVSVATLHRLWFMGIITFASDHGN